MKIPILALSVLIPLNSHSPARGTQETPTSLVPFQPLGPGAPHLGSVQMTCEAHPTAGLEATWMLLPPDFGLQDHTMMENGAFLPMVRFTLASSTFVPGELVPDYYEFLGNLEDFEDPQSGACKGEQAAASDEPRQYSPCMSLILKLGPDGLLLPLTSPRLLTLGLCNALPTVRVRLDG